VYKKWIVRRQHFSNIAPIPTSLNRNIESELMTTIQSATPNVEPKDAESPPGIFMQWVECPMRSVIAASITTMSTLGIVLSGIWAINVALP
jgi:hypothetical protein